MGMERRLWASRGRGGCAPFSRAFRDTIMQWRTNFRTALSGEAGFHQFISRIFAPSSSSGPAGPYRFHSPSSYCYYNSRNPYCFPVELFLRQLKDELRRTVEMIEMVPFGSAIPKALWDYCIHSVPVGLFSIPEVFAGKVDRSNECSSKIKSLTILE
uniref:Autophagy-related protein 101 n=1 Tax=Loa loa TaxID=7209 RepID=A0A1I7VIJ6_LOALO